MRHVPFLHQKIKLDTDRQALNYYTRSLKLITLKVMKTSYGKKGCKSGFSCLLRTAKYI